MIHDRLMNHAVEFGLARQLERLLERSRQRLKDRPHGEIQEWQALLEELPDAVPSKLDFRSDVVTIGDPRDVSAKQIQSIETVLLKMSPWRKGPFNLFGVYIDSEWRSELKWQRMRECLDSGALNGQSVLDVGSGNGYYLCRLLGEGAGFALGLDPTQRFVMQFEMLNKYFVDKAIGVLPLPDEALEGLGAGFDTVISMGVIYHRRDPMGHLRLLQQGLKESGRLILETLVIDGDADAVLQPEHRYAKMRNVWHIPSCLMAEQWLRDAGFRNIQLVDVSRTSAEEQRRTKWMQFESFGDFLDPNDESLTIEGYPAPTRALFCAER